MINMEVEIYQIIHNENLTLEELETLKEIIEEFNNEEEIDLTK